jgi:hypothetical protein
MIRLFDKIFGFFGYERKHKSWMDTYVDGTTKGYHRVPIEDTQVEDDSVLGVCKLRKRIEFIDETKPISEAEELSRKLTEGEWRRLGGDF